MVCWDYFVSSRNIILIGPVVVILTFSSQAYSNLLRAHMDGLKKKDKKSKSKKTKATQWAMDSWIWSWMSKWVCAVSEDGNGLV